MLINKEMDEIWNQKLYTQVQYDHIMPRRLKGSAGTAQFRRSDPMPKKS